MSSFDLSSVKSIEIPEGNAKKIEVNGVTVWEHHEDMPDYLCFTANEAGSTMSMQTFSNVPTVSAPTVSLEYSTDRNTWNTFTVGTTTVTLTNIGDKVYFRGTNTGFATYVYPALAHNFFVMTGSISASGNIMTILDSVGELSSIPSSYCFARLFYDCEALTTAPELPATTLADWCYYEMFYECTSLENITVHFSEWLDGATDDWLSGVKSSGTFYCPSSLEDIRDDSHIPTGWTRVDNDT